MSAIERLSNLVTSDQMRVDRVLSDLPPVKQVKDDAIPLPPVSRPEEGAAAFLHDIAFNNPGHPLAGVSQELFYSNGVLSPKGSEGIKPIKGLIEQGPEGTIISKPVIDVFSSK